MKKLLLIALILSNLAWFGVAMIAWCSQTQENQAEPKREFTKIEYPAITPFTDTLKIPDFELYSPPMVSELDSTIIPSQYVKGDTLIASEPYGALLALIPDSLTKNGFYMFSNWELHYINSGKFLIKKTGTIKKVY